MVRQKYTIPYFCAPMTTRNLLKRIFSILIPIFIFHNTVSAQVQPITPHQKGNFYFYWGWNFDAYTKSDIHFTGKDYDFTLQKVSAKDRQSPLEANTYLNPGNATIPQYNFRMGYFFKNHWNVSIGIDHMKYVVTQNQTVGIDGSIHNSNTPYDSNYNRGKVQLTPDFLKFEHTDGLNYLNAEVRRTFPLLTFAKSSLNGTAGAGFGALVPRTNTTLLSKDRYDEFHLAGFGIAAVGGLNFTFFKYFFIQTEVKFGFIDMPDIRTTQYREDKAKQSFGFRQENIVFGGIIPILKRN